MSAVEVGTKLVELCKDGKGLEAIDTLYAPNVVSIEGQGTEEMPARIEGFDAVRGKSVWWYDNHEVHSLGVAGPFCGHRADQFVVQFDLDVTNKKSGEPLKMSEVGIYTVADGKVVQEEFLYQV